MMNLTGTPIDLSNPDLFSECYGLILPKTDACIVFIHSSNIAEHARNQHYGSRAHRKRLNDLRDMGHTLALCTIYEPNIAQRTILINNGWNRITFFKTKSAEGLYSLWYKEL